MPIQETQIQKNCRIKSGGLTRYIKEYNSYCKEVQQDKAKIIKAKEEGKDQYTLNKMGEVLSETEAMVPHVKNKLVEATEACELWLEEHQDHEELAGTELLEKA